MRIELEEKYSPPEVEDFLKEIMKFLFIKLSPKGELDLRNNYLAWYPSNMNIFLEGMKQDMTLTKLDLGFNGLLADSECVKILFEVLNQYTTLTELDLTANLLGYNPETMKTFVNGLKLNKTITKLNLKRNSLLGYRCLDLLRILLEGLKENPSITTLDLRNNSYEYNPDSIRVISGVLRDVNYTLDFLDNDLYHFDCNEKENGKIQSRLKIIISL